MIGGRDDEAQLVDGDAVGGCSDGGNGLHDGRIPCIRLQAAHEGPVDLEGVHRKALEMGQGGIACAEIVKRDGDAFSAQGPQGPFHQLGAGPEEHAFGHLHLEAMRRHAGSPQLLEHALGIVVAPELGRRRVDGDAPDRQTGIEPAAHVVQHAGAHALADGGAEFGIVEGRGDLFRRLDPAVGMMPT